MVSPSAMEDRSVRDRGSPRRRRSDGCAASRDGLVQPRLPAVEQAVAFVRGRVAFVGEIVGARGKRIDARPREAASVRGSRRDATGKFS